MNTTKPITALLATLLLSATLAAPAAADQPPPSRPAHCHYVLGFATLDAAISSVAGPCLDDQHFSGNGDAIQHSANGEFVWRKATNSTAFTNGSQTWVNGPCGVQQRPNRQVFGWEMQAAGWPGYSSCGLAQVDLRTGEPLPAGPFNAGDFSITIPGPGWTYGQLPQSDIPMLCPVAAGAGWTTLGCVHIASGQWSQALAAAQREQAANAAAASQQQSCSQSAQTLAASITCTLSAEVRQRPELSPTTTPHGQPALSVSDSGCTPYAAGPGLLSTFCQVVVTGAAHPTAQSQAIFFYRPTYGNGDSDTAALGKLFQQLMATVVAA